MNEHNLSDAEVEDEEFISNYLLNGDSGNEVDTGNDNSANVAASGITSSVKNVDSDNATSSIGTGHQLDKLNLPLDIKEILETSIDVQSQQPQHPQLPKNNFTLQNRIGVDESDSTDSSDESESESESDEDAIDVENTSDKGWETDSNPEIENLNNEIETSVDLDKKVKFSEKIDLNQLDESDLDIDDGQPLIVNDDGFKTKNEMKPTITPLPFEYFDKNTQLINIGYVNSIVDNVVVIQSVLSGDFQTIDYGTLLCLEDGKLLGEIYETFGTITSPLHSILIDESKFDKGSVKKGDKIYYAPSFAKIVDTQQLREIKGSDASNVYDEEVPAHQQEFSDDEQEQEFKRNAKKNKSKGKGKSKSAGKPDGHEDEFVDYALISRSSNTANNDNVEVLLNNAQNNTSNVRKSTSTRGGKGRGRGNRHYVFDNRDRNNNNANDSYNPTQPQLPQFNSPFQFMNYNPMLMAQQMANMQAQMQL